MSTRSKWIWTIVVLLIILVLGAAAFAAGKWFSYGGMMGGFDGSERGFYHMQPYDRYSFGFRSPLGWLGMGLGMLLMWGLPLAILALAVIGAVSLFRGSEARQPVHTAAPASAPAVEPVAAVAASDSRDCQNCGKPAQTDWNTCPYCGTPLV